jgi:hypothetical protein
MEFHNGDHGCKKCEKCKGVFMAPDLSSEYVLTCNYEFFHGDTDEPCLNFESFSEETIQSHKYAKEVFDKAMKILNEMSDEEFEKSLEKYL